jgi:purine-binding chemotaxis protein CheW
MSWDLDRITVADDRSRQFIAFEVGQDRYALPIESVIEFRTWIEPTAMPNTPVYLRGVINVRGEIIPIYDFAGRLGRPLTNATPRHVVILTQNQASQTTGLLIDQVLDILSVQPEEISAMPRIDGVDAAPFLTGVVAVDGELLGIVDVDRLVFEGPLMVPGS